MRLLLPFECFVLHTDTDADADADADADTDTDTDRQTDRHCRGCFWLANGFGKSWPYLLHTGV